MDNLTHTERRKALKKLDYLYRTNLKFKEWVNKKVEEDLRKMFEQCFY